MAVPTNLKCPALLDLYLSRIDHFIWPNSQKVNDESTTFYLYKAFPNNLKGKEASQWAKLQVQASSPFKNGSEYAYISSNGLHLWYSAQSIEGLPETAAQQALPDGNHCVKGVTHIYEQTWSNGVMQSCIVKDTGPSEINKGNQTLIHHDSPWAIPRKIDQELQKPFTWLVFLVLIFVYGLAWFGVGFTTTYIQATNAEIKASALTESLGEKLAQQNTLRANFQTLEALTDWHQQHGFFPEAFSIIVENLLKQSDWKAPTISWQNKVLEVELVSSSLDITELVASLEKSPVLEQVNIRPHNSADTWILEARVK